VLVDSALVLDEDVLKRGESGRSGETATSSAKTFPTNPNPTTPFFPVGQGETGNPRMKHETRAMHPFALTLFVR